jgi:predicted sulfurtransferase
MSTPSEDENSWIEDQRILIDPTLHENWRIALYYYYIDLPNVPEHVQLHRHLCESMNFKGRIRVSSEGINGVLSGWHVHLQEYERIITDELKRLSNTSTSTSITSMPNDDVTLDVKYCLLREDLLIDAQLFESLMIKETKTVISLFDQEALFPASKTSSNRHSKQSNRRRRRKEHRQQQKQADADASESLAGNADVGNIAHGSVQREMMESLPAPHLQAAEWNEKLLQAAKNTTTNNSAGGENKALLLDVRNVYESRVGHFTVPNVPTLLTNTRKYSDLPHLLATNPHVQDTQQIYMYCTGGVRCERVSQLVQTLYPDKQVYQLQGGIQTYLRNSDQDDLFQGKNFVFDPRRTDPVHFGAIMGTCLVCHTPHDDYDNGHAPSEQKEARCNTCRMLILVCNTCRPKYRSGPAETDDDTDTDTDTDRPLLYCGNDQCVHEGVAPKPELIMANKEGDEQSVKK